jgi:chromosome segregation protein
MLKALELIGFKSFADKTRFEFPPGITVVVGPNGSGKSNVVDAIKWVLGEQSAKSLRGKDMADVIFKGTGENGRKPLNTAEVTIIFDNQARRLSVDADEVRVTRRVYRSGEGEYLINGQPSRLKDIRDMFRGTGVGTDAYSLIEQGKVDQMLQASPKDRRAMFEEAAGISRFKAKKAESQRRLERVEQNLLRLKDIVDEIENRVRMVRSQATKARRYREFSERLQQLRTHVAAVDWRNLTAQLDASERELEELRGEAGRFAAEAEECESRAREADDRLSGIDESLRLMQGRLARAHEQIVSQEASAEQNHARGRELAEASLRYRRQLAAMSGRVGDVRERLRETTSALAAADGMLGEFSQRVAEQERWLTESMRKLDDSRSQLETLRAAQVEGMRQFAACRSRISGLESQLAGAVAAGEALRARREALLARIRAAESDLAHQESAEAEMAEDAERRRRMLAEGEREVARLRGCLSDTRDRLVQMQHRQAACRERAAVLEELERNREGLTDGVREVLELAQQAEWDAAPEIAGLVADVLQVDVDVAPLVDIALGDAAQHIVLSGGRLLEEIKSTRYRPAGRVGFVLATEPVPALPPGDFAQRPGVIGRADRLVRCDPRYRPLVTRLLGATWLVHSLTIALTLRTSHGRGERFVAATGELVEPSGVIVIGPRATVAGLVSRRNELRELRAQLEVQAQLLAEMQSRFGQELQAVEQQELLVKQWLDEHAHSSAALAAHRVQVESAREQCRALAAQRDSLAEEIGTAGRQEEELRLELLAARDDAERLDARLQQLQRQLQETDSAVQALERQREHVANDATALKVELAKAEQHAETLRARMTQFQEDERERSRAILDATSLVTQSQDRLRQTDRDLLRASSLLAELYLAKESSLGEQRRLQAARETLAAERARWSVQLNGLRKRVQQLGELLHRKELTAHDLRHERQGLAERIRDDYGIEIEQLEGAAGDAQQSAREEIEYEIADLRHKLGQLGSVNMEALAELDELESRFQALSGQYQDLIAAKESLENIIQKINADSRRLFQETLEAVRANFQALYRKAFGGGRADIVLEEDVEPLEAGVELLATPPGKPQFNNSLLSGGEKALTAVALLLAIFQYRPSPFCVLDEVDAPFDEANIGRFVEVLRGFLGWTKFVIVTHSKKTMTAATTLYGVTMQESGVSKRVSVRFEDVNDDGHIRPDAIDTSRQAA